MHLKAALADPAQRERAVRRYVAKAVEPGRAELAEQLAQPEPAIIRLPVVEQAPAAPAARRATPPKADLTPQASVVLDLADRPDGVTISDVAKALQVHTVTANFHLTRLVESRRLTRVKPRGEASWRFWANPAHALAYTEARVADADESTAEVFKRQAEAAAFPAPTPAPAPAVVTLSPAERRSVEIHAAKVRGAKAAPPPLGKRTVSVSKAKANLTFSPPKIDDTKMRPAGQPIRTEKTIETIDTTMRANNRMEAAPPLPPDPRYPSFSSTPLGVNPDTGLAWGSTA